MPRETVFERSSDVPFAPRCSSILMGSPSVHRTVIEKFVNRRATEILSAAVVSRRERDDIQQQVHEILKKEEKKETSER
jgi:hypothetical protein